MGWWDLAQYDASMAARESAASATASATLVTTAASWRDRSRSWLPLGNSPIPHAELDAFLSDARRTLHRANKAEVLDVFPAWSECIRALADNPLVLLRGEAAATLISTAIDLLSGKLAPSFAADETIRKRCAHAEWWCTSFVRTLAGGPAGDAGPRAPQLALAADAGSVLAAQTEALVRQLVRTLERERMGAARPPALVKGTRG